MVIVLKVGMGKHELVNIIIRIITSRAIPFRDQFFKKSLNVRISPEKTNFGSEVWSQIDVVAK